MQGFQISPQALNAEQAETIKATLPAVGAAIEDITKNFYQRMFTAHPELLANTFNRGNQAQGAQQKALAASVATFATYLVSENTKSPDSLLSRIGHKHVSVGIRPDQYPIVHKHLFDAIEEVLTPEVFQGEVRAAWDAVYKEMERVLIDFESDLYQEREVAPGEVFLNTVVAKREELDPNTVRFQLDTTLDFKPGQYISVRQTLSDGAQQLRQYSLVNAPGTPLEFVVRKVNDDPQGEVSTQLCQHLQVGDELEISLPAGDLTLGEHERIVLVSSGIGATPMVGMLAALQGSQQQVAVYHQDKSELADVLRPQRERYLKGIANSSHTVAYRPERLSLEVAPDAHVYLCGGTDFLQAMREQLGHLPAEQLHFELFHPNDWLLA
ncbi:globin domain-containing protein [Corynebacterium pseudopelargi]|nr:globin domain-containing protein [Corynebacterium pseudopelargi]